MYPVVILLRQRGAGLYCRNIISVAIFYFSVSHLSRYSLIDKPNEGIPGNNETRYCGCMDIPREGQQDKTSTGKRFMLLPFRKGNLSLYPFSLCFWG